MTNKVCLIYTGGTIGMTRDNAGVLRPPASPQDFLNVAPELGDIVDFDFVPLINKDSTNINPEDWSKIAQAIYARRDESYIGFVVAHGTDTMHFSASAVAFALGSKLNFPVVFTGAQTIPDIEHGDARINLMRAMKVAQEDIAEVVISFGDFVFRGSRAQKKDEKKFDAFESPALYPIADITEKIILHSTAVNRDHEHAGEIELRADFAEGIVQIGLIPGMKPKLLEPILEQSDCEGIILQSFGAGNVPEGGEKPEDKEKYDFGPFIRKATEYRIPVIITSQFPANSTLDTMYGPGKAAIDAGAIATGNMTAAAANAKARWILAQVNADLDNQHLAERDKMTAIREKMQTIYVREMD